MKLTIREIARLAGASPSAVSFVLNGKDEKRVSAEKRDAILRVVQEHGYRRSATARALKLQRSLKVGLVQCGTLAEIPIVGFASHYQLTANAASLLHSQGYGVGLLQLRPGEIDAMAAMLLQEEVDGFLLADFPPQTAAALMRALEQEERPVVSMGTQLEGKARWAAIDREGSFAAAVEHLAGAGLRQIAVLDTDLWQQGGGIEELHHQARFRGYEQAMQRHGLLPMPVVAMEAATVRAAKTAVKRLLDQAPEVEGVLLTDNYFAPVVQMALAERTVRLVGFGDQSFADCCEPRLTYMRLPVDVLADTCVDHLLACIEDEEAPEPLARWLPCDLVAGET